MRKHDLRDIQSQLAALGLSSLGRSESSALAGLEAVIAVLEKLAGAPGPDPRRMRPAWLSRRDRPSSRNTPICSSGLHPKGRAVRIMVTMPSEAAESYELVKSLVEAGMDVMRVNCAHDTEREWGQMIANMRRANQEAGKHCRVAMDLAGPKLRTGPIHRGYHVVRWKVGRDARGAVDRPARIALASGHASPKFRCRLPTSLLPVPETLLRAARLGNTVHVRNSSGKDRELTVIHKADHVCICTCEQGA